MVPGEPALRGLLERFVLALECQVRTTIRFEDAVQALQQHSYDLLLVDTSSNAEGSRHCVETVRNAGCQIPILIIVGSGEDLFPVQMQTALGFQILSKPFGLSDLRSAVVQCLAQD